MSQGNNNICQEMFVLINSENATDQIIKFMKYFFLNLCLEENSFKYTSQKRRKPAKSVSTKELKTNNYKNSVKKIRVEKVLFLDNKIERIFNGEG